MLLVIKNIGKVLLNQKALKHHAFREELKRKDVNFNLLFNYTQEFFVSLSLCLYNMLQKYRRPPTLLSNVILHWAFAGPLPTNHPFL